MPAFVAGRTGIGLSQRMQSFDMSAAENPYNVLQPGQRPRATLSPSLALKDGEPQRAISLFGEAQELIDSWIGRYLLGQAYLAAEAYTEAYSEFEACLKRRGEATAVFLDDVPSYYYFPPVYYWLGRAQEGLGSPGATDSYRTFLAIKESGDGTPLVADARRRLQAL